MSKIIFLSFVLFTVIFLLIVNTSSVYALEKCLMSTDPSPLTDETQAAKFIVSVANLGGVSAFSGWRIEFLCGFLHSEGNATIDKTDKIYIDVLRTPADCRFSAGGHKVKMKGVRSDGKVVDQCEASYGVKETKSLCKLSIHPETGITSNSDITISGENLQSGGRFSVFVDSQRINLGLNSYVNTPNFSDLQLPANFLTLGFHKIDLRELEVKISLNPLDPPGTKYGNPLCSLGFSVGTDANPGSVSLSGPAGVVNWIPGVASFNKDLQCDDDTQNPGIATAIGCIHTSPAGFVKDFLKFALAISGGLAFLMMLLGSFQMLTSAGNPETLAAGKDRLQSAVIGLLIIIFATLLLRIIGVDILGLGGQFGL